ncbi:hypothetical protein MTO96_013417 [Rhipicephalus appendiculatus]
MPCVRVLRTDTRRQQAVCDSGDSVAQPFAPPRGDGYRGQLAKRATALYSRALLARGAPRHDSSPVDVQSACRQLTIGGADQRKQRWSPKGKGCRTRPRPGGVRRKPVTPRVSKALTGDKREKGRVQQGRDPVAITPAEGSRGPY